MAIYNNEIERRNYVNVHSWLIRIYGNAYRCDQCHIDNAKRFEWALKKGCTYERNVANFFQLCKSCHIKYDMTDETKRKMSETRTGMKRSSETKLKMSLTHKSIDKSYLKGRILSQETKDKISKAKRGISVGIGRKHTDAHKAAIKAAAHKKMNEHQVSEAMSLYKNGLSMRDIAKIYNTSHTTISSYFNQINL